MPKLSGIKIAHRRALNRIQIPGELPSPDIRLTAAQWVKTLRVGFHMTQRQLAERAGVTQNHVARIESGRLEPKLHTLRRLFGAMFCDFVVLPIPRERLSSVIARSSVGVPHRRMWDPTPWSREPPFRQRVSD